MFKDIIGFIRNQYPGQETIPLHAPVFPGNEKRYLLECIDSTYVSSVGSFVGAFEKSVAGFVGSKHAIAVVNGTQALFVALQLAGVERASEVITQSLTFVATANAIRYVGAEPVFVDVDEDTLGMSPSALQNFLQTHAVVRDEKLINRFSGRRITACLPMHTLGHACHMDDLVQICQEWGLPVVEDAAESLGSYYQGRHTGTFGLLGVFSFNGNKVVTTGGGGMIVTDDDTLAKRAKHLTTTAKVPHHWEFFHDELGYNFRLPNLNAALGVAQMENLPRFLTFKRELAVRYQQFFETMGICFVHQPSCGMSNYWLNALVLEDERQRDAFLQSTNEAGVMTRCLWRPMHMLDMYQHCQRDSLVMTDQLYQRVVNIPSGVVL
jgi:aminotransferase in exopolysaccharide biosynthesis